MCMGESGVYDAGMLTEDAALSAALALAVEPSAAVRMTQLFATQGSLLRVGNQTRFPADELRLPPHCSCQSYRPPCPWCVDCSVGYGSAGRDVVEPCQRQAPLLADCRR